MKTLRTILLIAACSAGLVRGGLVISTETEELRDGRETYKGTLYIQGDKMKMVIKEEDPGVEPSSVIFDGKTKTMWMIDPGRKTYTEMDEASMEAMTGQVKQAMKQLEEQLAKMPPEQQAMMRQMMGSAQPAGRETRVRRGAGQRTVRGMPCRQYEMYVGGEKAGDIWVTEYANANVQPGSLDVLADVGALYEELLSTLRSMPMVQMPANPLTAFGHIDGFPVLIERYEDGQISARTHLIPLGERSLPETAFQLPEGYRKQELPAMR